MAAKLIMLLCFYQPFVPLNDVPYHFINTLDDLVALNEKLLKCSEFAVDLEVRRHPILELFLYYL